MISPIAALRIRVYVIGLYIPGYSMKLPSISQITDAAARTARRFPYAIAVAAAGTVAAVMLIERQDGPLATMAFRVLWGALLAFPLLAALGLLAEKRMIGSGMRHVLQVGGLLLAAGYAATMPGNPELAPEMHGMRLAMLVVAAWLALTVAPWLGRGGVNGFWQYNKTLFLRAALAALFTGVLFAGLAIALAAVENLFEIPVPGERYGQLWAMLVGMFATWFFLAGVPEDLAALDTADDYPKGLKIFAQYVVLPLVAVYLLILVAYAGKIVLAWDWPQGTVSGLILGFAAAGLAAFLLLHPLREREGSRWIGATSRWFFIVLAPLLVMYFLAVLRRLSDYGMTEGRYIAVVTGLWLFAVVVYFLFSRAKNIKLLPLSVAVIALLISFGPWGAFSVSEGSQVYRLRTMLERNGLLADGRLTVSADKEKRERDVPPEDAREISAVLQYLQQVHGYEAIAPWFTMSLRADDDDAPEWKAPSDVAAMLGIDYVAGGVGMVGGKVIFEAMTKHGTDVRGYDRVLPEFMVDKDWQQLRFPSGDLTSVLDHELLHFTLVRMQEGNPADSLTLSLRPVLDSLMAQYQGFGAAEIPMQRMSVTGENAAMKVKVYFLMIRATWEDGTLHPASMRLRVLYGREDAATAVTP